MVLNHEKNSGGLITRELFGHSTAQRIAGDIATDIKVHHIELMARPPSQTIGVVKEMPVIQPVEVAQSVIPLLPALTPSSLAAQEAAQKAGARNIKRRSQTTGLVAVDPRPAFKSDRLLHRPPFKIDLEAEQNATVLYYLSCIGAKKKESEYLALTATVITQLNQALQGEMLLKTIQEITLPLLGWYFNVYILNETPGNPQKNLPNWLTKKLTSATAISPVDRPIPPNISDTPHRANHTG